MALVGAVEGHQHRLHGDADGPARPDCRQVDRTASGRAGIHQGCRDRVARDRHLDRDNGTLVGDAIPVHRDLGAIGAVRKVLEAAAHGHARPLDDVRHRRPYTLDRVAAAELPDTFDAASAGGDLSLEVAPDRLGQTDVVENQIADLAVFLAAAHEFLVAEADALLVDVDRVRTPASGCLGPDVCPVRGGDGERDQPALGKHRHVDRDV